MTLNFGPVLKDDVLIPSARGAWHLWVYFGEWTIKEDEAVQATSDDQRSIMTAAIEQLNGRELFSWDHKHLSTSFIFADRAALTVTSTDDREPGWMLYLPTGQVLTFGPRDRLSLSEATSDT